MSFWNERYAADEYVYGTAPNDFLAAEYAAMPPGPVLCLADGEGRNGVFLAQQGYAVTSVDASSVGLAKATRLAAARGVTLTTHVADLAEFDLGAGHWSGIVSIFAHLPPVLRADVHRRAAAALKPGGVFLLEAYTPRHREIGGVGGPPDASWLMALAALREELAPLEIVLGREIEREVNEGQHHRGRAAVVQVIARRPPR